MHFVKLLAEKTMQRKSERNKNGTSLLYKLYKIKTHLASLWIRTISLRSKGFPVSMGELDSTDSRRLKGSHIPWASR